MKLYLENGGLPRNLWHISQCVNKLEPRINLELCVISKGRMSPVELSAMAAVHKQVKKITLVLPAQKLTDGIVYFANKDKGLKLQLWTDREITEPVWKRICRLVCVVPLWDLSENTHNRQRIQSNRNLVYSDRTGQGVEQIDLYNLVANKPIEYCTYSSCLGKNLYISKSGAVSYCPRYPEKTQAGILQEMDAFFEDDTFNDLLTKMIAKRNVCKKTCAHFTRCQAGCAFESNCGHFPDRYQTAREDVEKYIEEKANLSQIPLYKEQTILYKIFSKVRENT